MIKLTLKLWGAFRAANSTTKSETEETNGQIGGSFSFISVWVMSLWGHCPLTDVPNLTLSELKKRCWGVFEFTLIPHKPPARIPQDEFASRNRWWKGNDIMTKRWDEWERWALPGSFGTIKNVILFERLNKQEQHHFSPVCTFDTDISCLGKPHECKSFYSDLAFLFVDSKHVECNGFLVMNWVQNEAYLWQIKALLILWHKAEISNASLELEMIPIPL